MNSRVLVGVVSVVAASVTACSVPPTPSRYRQALIDAGVQKRVAGLVVHDEGTGPAVVMLHGLGGSAYDFRHQRKAFIEAGYRVIVPDMIGAGYTGFPDGAACDVQSQADHVLRLLNALGVGRAHFIGNSYGGGVTLAIAALHPERVDRMVLLDAAAVPQEFPWYVKLARAGALGRLVFNVSPKSVMADIMIGFLAHRTDAFTEEELAEYAHELSFDCAGPVDLACALNVNDARALMGQLEGVKAPTLILWGANDRVVPLESGKRLALEIRGAVLEVYEECGHVPHMERPPEVTERMLTFLKREEPVHEPR